MPHEFFDNYEATETSLKLRNKQELGKSLFKGKSPCLFLKDTFLSVATGNKLAKL